MYIIFFSFRLYAANGREGRGDLVTLHYDCRRAHYGYYGTTALDSNDYTVSHCKTFNYPIHREMNVELIPKKGIQIKQNT